MLEHKQNKTKTQRNPMIYCRFCFVFFRSLSIFFFFFSFLFFSTSDEVLFFLNKKKIKIKKKKEEEKNEGIVLIHFLNAAMSCKQFYDDDDNDVDYN